MKVSAVASLLLLGSIAISGCAETRPNVYAYPARGQTAEQQAQDRADCETWAKQQTGFDPASAAAKGGALGGLIGAVGGAATGAAVGAATGSPGKGAAVGAAAGGVGGAVIGGAYKYSKSREGYDQAYAACMAAHGYTVGGLAQLSPGPAPNPATPTTAAVQSTAEPPASKPKRLNLLAAENGGQLQLAPHEVFLNMISGKQSQFDAPAEAVFAFKNEQPATFDTFGLLVGAADAGNLKDFELLVGNESPTGSFRSIGKFEVKNARLIQTAGVQDFQFSPVAAKYLKVKFLSNYGATTARGTSWVGVQGLRLLGELGEAVPAAAAATSPEPAKPKVTNLLAAENGGQVLVAASDEILKIVSGNIAQFDLPSEAVFAFKDEQAATFDTFRVLVPSTDAGNLKDFELLVGDESPTGTFRSIGRFEVKNVRLLQTAGYQDFKFSPVTAKYLKVRFLSNYGARTARGTSWLVLQGLRLSGTLGDNKPK